MTEAMSYQSKVSINGTAVEFVSFGITATQELLSDEEGLRGTRSRSLERACQGLTRITGQMKMQPTPSEIALVLPLAMQSGTGETLTDALQDITIVEELQTITNTFTGRINKLTIGGGPGKKLDLTLDFVGYSYTTGGGGVSGTPDISSRPLMFSDTGGMVIGSTTYSIDEFEFVIDNHIEPTYMNGLVATDLEPSDREVTFKIRTKYTSVESGLLATAQSGPVLATPVSANISFTNGSHGFELSFPAVVAKPQTVPVNDKKKLRWSAEYNCYRVSNNLEVVATVS